MATMKDLGLSYARNAGANLSAALHKLVKVDTDGDIVLAGANEPILGVVIEAAVENKPVTVLYGGQGKVIVGAEGAITAGEMLASNASGLAKAGTSGAAGTFGMALTGGAVGELIEFVFNAG